MTVSRIPSYARRWPFETGRPASVLTRKALSHNRKIRELGAQLLVEQRLANPKALTALPRTSRVRRCRCSHMVAMTIGPRFPADRTRYLILSRIETIEGPSPVVCLLWTILAGRFLHAPTAVIGT